LYFYEWLRAARKTTVIRKDQNQRIMPQSTDIDQEKLGQTGVEKRSREEIALLLNSIRINIARVHHDLNNPLSIIAGNAQLLMELAKVMDLGDDILLPLQDIDEAGTKMAESLHKLIVLKDMIPRKSA